MKRNAVILVVAIIIVAGAIFIGARMSQRPKGSAAPVSEAAQAKVGKPAPDFTLKTLEGKDVRLSSLQGKAVLLNFWATWCEPCKIEMPWIIELNDKYKSQGLETVGVAMDDSGKDAIAKFVKEMKVDYTILQGNDEVGDQYGGVQFLPQTFYVGRDGKITKSVNGIVSESEIEDSIKQALAQGAAQSSAQANAAPISGAQPGK
jgi:cytochrome c biogenesis protein CcmG/thiol:disulfide interchange protein DsbE